MKTNEIPGKIIEAMNKAKAANDIPNANMFKRWLTVTQHGGRLSDSLVKIVMDYLEGVRS